MKSARVALPRSQHSCTFFLSTFFRINASSSELRGLIFFPFTNVDRGVRKDARARPMIFARVDIDAAFPGPLYEFIKYTTAVRFCCREFNNFDTAVSYPHYCFPFKHR